MVLIKRRVACLRRVWRVVDPCLSLRVTVCNFVRFRSMNAFFQCVNLSMRKQHTFMLLSGLGNISDNRVYRIMHFLRRLQILFYRHAIRAMPPTSKTPM